MQPRHGAQHRNLHVSRQAGTHALHIHFVGGAPFRFNEDLMPVLVRKAHELVLNAGAIACAGCVDLSAVHRGTVQVFKDHAVGFVVGIGQIARRLLAHEPAVEKRERGHWHIAILPLHLVIIQRAPVDACGRARLEPLHGYAEFAQCVGECFRAEQTGWTALSRKIAD
ncbi:hypothetical protein SDC9_103663 [bioreactor metagenome]|uniref:Uncharacterized protein n=1 Tax=bioreactor metagenome TaxID=1076179 RepID=A0A645AUR1_9ZZZZ